MSEPSRPESSPATPVLDRFALTPADLLAEGGESSIFALGSDRILRVGRPGVTYRQERYDLLDEIAAAGLPWPVPRRLELGTVGDVHYAVETRLPGLSLDIVLQTITGEARRFALTNYADGSLRIRRAQIERPWFGELYHSPPVRRPSWPSYLVERARLQIAKAGAAFAAEVPNLESVMERFERDVTTIGDVDRGLVHGDYFPGNVLVGHDLGITAVIDFGWSTLAGDPRLDAVCASVFLEVDRPWCTPEDAAFVRRRVEEQDPSVGAVFDLYRTFCALHFSFVIHYGIPLYRWCVRALREQGS